MVYPFHVVEEKTRKSVSFFLVSSAKKPSKRKELSNSFDKDRVDVLAASDQVSYFEQEKLIVLGEDEQSRWENETVGASRSKIEIICFASGRIQILQGIFPARSNILAHFVIDMSSIVKIK